MISKKEGKLGIKKLLERFAKKKDYYFNLNEEDTKIKLLQDLFESLGWSFRDTDYMEIRAEERSGPGSVDFSFKLNGITKFLLEAKRVKVPIEKHLKQAITYGYNKKVSWVVLCNFQSLFILSCDWKPTKNDLRFNIFKEYFYEDFEDKFDELWSYFSPEGIEQGNLNREAEEYKKKKKLVKIEDVFESLRKDFREWRSILYNSIKRNNKLKDSQIDEYVQKIIDRLIFCRFCEDKGFEEPYLGQINNQFKKSDAEFSIYKKLVAIFAKPYNRDYDSGLFEKHHCDSILLDNRSIVNVLQGLHGEPNSLKEYNFSQIPVDILGAVYEEYLTYLHHKKDKHDSKKKKQGIYYTPGYIVDYIVKNTVGEILKDKKRKFENIKILDPACGSGSFLIKVFDYMNEYKFKGKDHQAKLDFDAEKKIFTGQSQIITNSIYGVDLDNKAVDITRLNLLLKIARRDKRLPVLRDNIKWGNSLIDDENFSNKAFVWGEEFKSCKFDVIIGNPPWSAKFSKEEKEYFQDKFDSNTREIKSDLIFVEKVLDLISEGSYVGFILPNTWMYLSSTESIRKKILGECKIIYLIELTKGIFAGAPDIVPVIMIIKKSDSETSRGRNILRTKSFSHRKNILPEDLINIDYKKIKQNTLFKSQSQVFNLNLTEANSKLIKKIRSNTKELQSFVKTNYGVKTGNNFKYLADSKKRNNFKKCLKTKETKRYHIEWNSLWLDYGPYLAGHRKNSLEVPKIIVQYIRKLSLKRRLICSYDDVGEYYPLNNYSFITGKTDDLKYVLGILNSKLMNFYFSNTFIDYNIKPSYLNKLPILTNPKKTLLSKLVSLVSEIINLNKKIIGLGKGSYQKEKLVQKIQRIDKEIDDTVYKIYGLSIVEISRVEKFIK